MKPVSFLAIAALFSAVTACADEPAATGANKPAEALQTLTSERGKFTVETVIGGLENPWSVTFLPDGRMLVTERPGRLRYVSKNGQLSEPISGVPAVFATGQGGLLDVALSPTFATDQLIYLSYAEAADDGKTAGTAVARGRLQGNALTVVKRIYQQQPKLSTGAHFGSRLVFDGKGHLFITQGENNERPTSQDLTKLQGKLVRLNLDGSIPSDNPFIGRDDARPEIFSYGHRNMQGAALNPTTGALWTSEHGPRGGDELNIPQAGKNYGWPIITYGINYSGMKIPEAIGTSKEGMEQPLHYWAKSPGLSGLVFATASSAWKGNLFQGSLAQRNLIRVEVEGNKIGHEERLLVDMGQRIRDVREGPDGAIYVLTDEADGRLLKLTPPKP
ncbi:MAG: PQQ-dependent sugar dehydrogenase [Dokdonella sp.]